ncbi:hypothetical protein LEMLEM_LOCUS24025 [Lemmus lemmus]
MLMNDRRLRAVKHTGMKHRGPCAVSETHT